MTIYESLAHWLNDILTNPQNEFPPQLTMIDLEVSPNLNGETGAMDTGLFSNPNDIQTQLLSGRVRHEDFKTWYIKRKFIEFPDRLSNEAFFEKLRKCIHMKNLRAVYPQDGRKWRGIYYQGGIFVTQREPNNEHAIYQVNLKLVYEEIG